jgi:aspartyl-tRNA(Asn)/glutamyl-tRNA(Gln) amidotransferase subunit B
MWEAVIGLECHVQLRTATKMFCPCPVSEDAAPNTAVCEVCLGHPGALPTLNAEAVALGVRAAVALGCEVHPVSVFARKHYFYPDLPKGYQISQGDRPLATGGRIGAHRLARMHLEEDAGKMTHGPDGTVVDWNRAGVPLVEVVGEPDVGTPEAAEAWLRALHRVLVRAGVTTGDLEKGQLRCDANVSVHRAGEPFGARVEIKNVNSFRFVRNALRHEIDRQIAAGGVVRPETRTWTGHRTVALREKEETADYRWFPEPDLPPLRVTPAEVAAARDALPGAPLDVWLAEADAARVADWQARYGLSAYDVGVVTSSGEAADFYAAAVAAGGEPKAMANLVAAEVLRRANAEGLGRLEPAHLVGVQRMLDAGAINRDGARRLFDALAARGGDPEAQAAALGLRQVSDEGALRAIVADALARHPEERARYRAGNKGMMGFFMGEVMAATARQADPRLAQRLVREALDEDGTT